MLSFRSYLLEMWYKAFPKKKDAIIIEFNKVEVETETKIQPKMQIDRQKFYAEIKNQGLLKKLTQRQVDSINCIFDEFENQLIMDIRFLAYAMATTYHETAATMLPIEEYGKGRNRPYGSKIKHNRLPYTHPDKIYYGRGYVQLTWWENYLLMGRLLGYDLLNNPELALVPKIAAQILVEGMTRGASSFGDFTGRSLEMYFNDKKEDPVGARKIINSTDKAVLIANIYWKFKNALS